MKINEPQYVSTDVLVIGGGGAGLRSAIVAREKGTSVVLASKSMIGVGNNTALSKAAFASVNAPGDSLETHIKDTLVSGRFINNPRIVSRFVKEVQDVPAFLEKCDVPFEKEEGKFLISRSAGHSFPRTYQGEKRRGTSFTLPLKSYAQSVGVSFAEKVFVTKLLTKGERVTGATGINETGELVVFSARAVILTTGGIGQIYLNTNNAGGITGDGHSLAFEAGVPLRDMEFVQFYPTNVGGNKILLYEVFLSNLGAILRNAGRENILLKYAVKDAMAVTRDRLAQILFKEISEGNGISGGVIMDLSPVPDEKLMRVSYLLPPGALTGKREFIVAPVEHFHMGGIVTDEEARTSLMGLFACGEVAGGSHGANRLGSNALASVFGMGGVAAENATAFATQQETIKPDPKQISSEKARLESMTGAGSGNIRELTRSLKEVDWFNVGISRNEKGLKETLDKICEIRILAREAVANDVKELMSRLELENMLLAAEMVTRSAIERKESRGAHFREDFPEENPDWQKSVFVRNRNGKIALERMSVEAVK